MLGSGKELPAPDAEGAIWPRGATQGDELPATWATFGRLSSKEEVLNPMPDFSQPGDDGEILDGFAVWRRGVTCTVRREMLFPLPRGQEYRVNATVRSGSRCIGFTSSLPSLSAPCPT